jgi:hypothetical protein
VPLNITNVAVSGDFQQTNGCGSAVAPVTTCAIQVTFKPTASGLRTGTLTITDDAPGGGIQTVKLTGTGIPIVTLSTTSLSFGNQAVGSKSAPQTVTVTGNPNSATAINSITVTGTYLENDTCVGILNPGSTCLINVRFSPTTTGPAPGTLTINLPSSSAATVRLSGNGVLMTPTPTAIATPTRTATIRPTPTATATIVPGPPHISAIPAIVLVGGNFNITGSGFTVGSVVNFFVATGGPQFKMTLTPNSPHSATLMTVHVDDTIPLGTGFTSVVVVNTDTGFQMSNPGFALLQGDPAADIPTIQKVNSVSLADSSKDPSYATNNVQTVIVQGTMVTLAGTGFETGTQGAAVDLFCACPGGKVGPFFVSPVSSTSLSFALPAKGLPNSPNSGPGSLVVSNKGTGNYSMKSNAVAVPIGALVHVFSVKQTETLITVNGSGFSNLTVLNFFNKQIDGTKNLGGLDAAGKPIIPQTLVSDTVLTFTVPAGANPALSYVQEVSPPFVPFSSSGSDPGGSFTLQ